MRLLVLVLAALAGFKIWASNHLYRQAAEDVIIAAYRDRAIAACQRDTLAQPAAPAQASGGGPLLVSSWARPAAIRVVIGKPGLAVAVWDTEHADWRARYKQAFLMLEPAGAATETRAEARSACAYDITANHASLVRG